jgi:small-conductance mechanosensitive channel
MKKQDLKKLIKEDITEWLKERNIPEAGSGDMAYTEKAEVKEKIVKIEDQIAEFYYVTKPTKESAVEELVKSGDVFEFAMSGLTREDISGIYKSEGRAKSAANKVIKERDLKLKETYKKGQDKLKAMEASIDEIKGQIEGKMSEATSNPDMRESLTAESNSLMEKLSMLEAHINKLREVLEAEGMRFEKKKPKKDTKKDDKKDEKEDDKDKE